MSDAAVSAGQIITFYSYKGGTGRSMALANIACLLAQKTAIGNVLMIDWDLEAPGLHKFFLGKFNNPSTMPGNLPPGQLGLIDLFYEIKKRLEVSKSESDISEDLFDQININKYIVKLSRTSLFLMPAGKFDDGLYSTRVNQFDWSSFFNDFPTIITQLAQYLRKKFGFVLIDSRTGYTDISGICTSIMPEKLVVVFTPNHQNLSGAVEMIRRATSYRKQSDDLHPLMVFPLASRIESAEIELQKNWRFGNSDRQLDGYQKLMTSVLMDVYGLQKCDLTQYFDEYQLQYIPRYSYGEEIAVLAERSEYRLSLARSFENFAEKIITTEPPWEEIAKNEKDKVGKDLSTSQRVREVFRRLVVDWLTDPATTPRMINAMRGLGLFLTIWAFALICVRLQLVFPSTVIQWLSESPNPQQALIAFSALVSSGTLALVRLGIEVPALKYLFKSEMVRAYLAGIPLWILGTIFALGFGGLFLVFPACQSPSSVIFEVEGLASQKTYVPNETLVSEPYAILMITAQPIEEGKILSCKWQYIGDAFNDIGSESGCQITLKLSDQPGSGLLTLQTAQDFCNQSTIFSLNIKSVSP